MTNMRVHVLLYWSWKFATCSMPKVIFTTKTDFYYYYIGYTCLSQTKRIYQQ